MAALVDAQHFLDLRLSLQRKVFRRATAENENSRAALARFSRFVPFDSRAATAGADNVTAVLRRRPIVTN